MMLKSTLIQEAQHRKSHFFFFSHHVVINRASAPPNLSSVVNNAPAHTYQITHTK